MIGLDYADQRYYASTYGRFNTADPYMAAKHGANSPSKPGSWNRYSYVQGDPVNAKDPRGLFLLASEANNDDDDGEDDYDPFDDYWGYFGNPLYFQQQGPNLHGGGGARLRHCRSPIAMPVTCKTLCGIKRR
jgi:RHS repeat-associated protein